MSDKPMDLPTVSVIIPTFNRAAFICEAIESVLSQSYSAVELIVIDDGSTDNTAALLKPYIERCQIIYRYQENQRQSVARNHGLSIASGDYCCFLDSDNRWLPGKLKIQVDYLASHSEVDIVYGDNQLIDESGVVTSKQNMRRHSGLIYPFMLKDNCVSMNTVMARMKCFKEQGGFDPEFKVADDYELWLRMSAHYRFAYLPQFFAQYRVMDEQISSNKERRYSSNERALQKFFQLNPQLVSARKKRMYMAHFYCRWARLRMAKGDNHGFLQLLLLAFKQQWYSSAIWRVALKWMLPK
jgi:glycosyltransferase involved in cell wall biosynthesis